MITTLRLPESSTLKVEAADGTLLFEAEAITLDEILGVAQQDTDPTLIREWSAKYADLLSKEYCTPITSSQAWMIAMACTSMVAGLKKTVSFMPELRNSTDSTPTS